MADSVVTTPKDTKDTKDTKVCDCDKWMWIVALIIAILVILYLTVYKSYMQ